MYIYDLVTLCPGSWLAAPSFEVPVASKETFFFSFPGGDLRRPPVDGELERDPDRLEEADFGD